MKRIAVLVASLCIVFLTCGCGTPNTTPPPAALAPGYLSQTDQQMGEALAAAHAFYVQIQSDITAGKYTPSATEKTALNAFAASINAAQAAYLAYHASPTAANQTAASNAVQQVETQQATLQPEVIQ